MRYVMIIAGDEQNWYADEAVTARLMEEIGLWWEKWAQAGKVIEGGAELQPASTAKTIKNGADGRPTVTDGPYLEIKEIVGGFVNIVADDIDEAVAVASAWPGIAVGDLIEVRPVMER